MADFPVNLMAAISKNTSDRDIGFIHDIDGSLDVDFFDTLILTAPAKLAILYMIYFMLIKAAKGIHLGIHSIAPFAITAEENKYF